MYLKLKLKLYWLQKYTKTNNLLFSYNMKQSPIILEPTNRGKPTNPEIEINPYLASDTIPQAWESDGDWYYNFPWAKLECWELLPSWEQWVDILKSEENIESLRQSYKWYRDFSPTAVWCIGMHWNYWTSSRTTIYNAHYVQITPFRVAPIFENYRAMGFSVRCIQK